MPGDKRQVFEMVARVFFVAAASKRCALTSATRDILIAATPRVLVVFRHDFGLVGGCGAIVAMVLYNRGRLRVHYF